MAGARRDITTTERVAAGLAIVIVLGQFALTVACVRSAVRSLSPRAPAAVTMASPPYGASAQ